MYWVFVCSVIWITLLKEANAHFYRRRGVSEQKYQNFFLFLLMKYKIVWSRHGLKQQNNSCLRCLIFKFLAQAINQLLLSRQPYSFGKSGNAATFYSFICELVKLHFLRIYSCNFCWCQSFILKVLQWASRQAKPQTVLADPCFVRLGLN